MHTRIDTARTQLLDTEARLKSLRDLSAKNRLDARGKHDLANALTLLMSSREILADENPEDELIGEAESALRRAMEIAIGIGPHLEAA